MFFAALVINAVAPIDARDCRTSTDLKKMRGQGSPNVAADPGNMEAH